MRREIITTEEAKTSKDKFIAEHSTVEIPLFPFQRVGSDHILKYKRFTIADEMGLGKTRTLIKAASIIKPERILIICTKNAFPTWKNQTEEFLDVEVLYVRGNAKQRYAIWNTPYEGRMQMFIMTAALLRFDLKTMPRKWKMIALDEYDRFMSNRSKTVKLLKYLQTEYLIPITGSPMHKGPQNLWPMLNLLDPKRFTSYWRFVERYCYVDQTHFGREIYGVQHEEELQELLEKYFIRHLKDEVAPQIPKKLRNKLHVEMEPRQFKAYKQIELEMMALVEDEVYVAENVLEQLIRLRQFLCCPKILNESLPDGAGLDAIIDKMVTDPHVVIFVPFISAIPYIKARLEKEGYEHIVTFQGGMTAEQMVANTEEFEKYRGQAIVSIAYAQSFELPTSKYGFFLGWDYIPDTNKQAEDRMHRLITTHRVNYDYIVHDESIDEQLLDSINTLNMTITKTLQSRQGAKKFLE